MPASNEMEQEPLLKPLDPAVDDCSPSFVDADGSVQPRTEVQDPARDQPITSPGVRAYISTIILFLINLLNYIDRYTIAANLIAIQKTYCIDDNNGAAGLVQTAFIIGYMITSPMFGYLGDRYSRKIIMSSGILFWAGMTLLGSFIPANMFWLFVLVRGLVGVGEASYITISVTIIGDLFVGNRRTQMLMFYFFAIPVGSGLGYIGGKGIASAFNDWRWALRITPALGVASVICVMLIIKEPSRGQAETGNHTISSQRYIEDLKALLKNKTYLFTTLGFTSIAWVVGGLALWLVKLMELIYDYHHQDDTNVSFIFGGLTVAAGFSGVTIGTVGAQIYRRYNPRADALVCALGNLLAAPFLFVGLTFAVTSEGLGWTCILLGEICLFLNWALVPDMLMQVLIPVRRSTGNGIQLLSGHLFGDALSPYIIGAVSDLIRGDGSTYLERYQGLAYSLYMAVFLSVIGGGFFLAASLYIERDRAHMQETLQACQETEAHQTDNDDIGQPVNARNNEDVVI
ncbi:protein spinster homolog 1-like [Acanthaster planci]|uniref:Protein spinster homolog 1-like n=1 Tax=Acanthaster planci TaxID=133434 RepID=A0A8B7XXY7_ACAPL|nr:protein spinster homolog 1-like [Acanthaster planci]XP_022085755.1 protein spinster homolog 1-like [Acanthaster planci]XP_022085757.1 protein spinster homolog 1-like [Acanthaster planci]XP_022085758.1 protein spinster homolog 1-like [Acanthaster planci]